MPVTYEKDKDGRLQKRGNWTPGAPTGGSGPKPKPQGFNPFAEIGKQIKRGVNAADNAIRYEQKRYAQDPAKRFREVTGRLNNDARYELKQLSTPGGAVRSVVRATQTLTAGAGNPVLGLGRTKLEPVTTSAVADVVRNGVELGQRLTGRKKGDYAVNSIGQWADRVEEKAYRKYGWTPREEQTGATRIGTELGIGGMQALAGGAAFGAAGLAATKLPLVGGAIGRGGAAFARLLDPTKAQTFLGLLGRSAVAGGAEELATLPFQDNTGGGMVSLLNAVLDTDYEDPVKPEMDRIEAMQAAAPGNVLAGATIGGALLPLLGGAFRAIGRAKRSAAEVRPIKEAREALASNGVLETDPDTGTSRFTDEVLNQPAPKAPEAPPANYADTKKVDLAGVWDQANADRKKARNAAATPDPWETPAAEAPVFDGPELLGTEPDPWKAEDAKPLEAPEPEADPFDPSRFDPETTFEADVVYSQLRELSHAELEELYQLDPGELLTFNLERIAGSRTPTALGDEVKWENVSAPKDKLSELWLAEKYPARLAALDPETLRGLFRNSPELQAQARAITGKSLDQLTKQDMVLVLLQHPERALLPTRLDNPFESVWDLSVKPDEYQFKQNVNEKGVQANNSLSGVERWNPDAEGTLEVRRVPETGELDMVNGHNRLDKAKELGIPSVPVKYIRTETAAEAREMGAISNISSGGGTVWDAAKFIRENPQLDTVARQKAEGLPGKSSFWRDGLALSRLPEDLFKAAQDGVIEAKYAVLIGNSGLDETKMRTLFRKAVSKPSVDSMLAYIEIARVAGAGDVDQGLLFGGGAEDLTDQLADLYSDLQRAIADDKLLFGRVSKGAEKLRTMTESTVDVAGSIQISEAAKQAQRFVKDNWVSYPDLAKAMQDGARAIKNGASKASVVREIKQALPGMIDDAMAGGGGGKTLEFEEGAAQGSLLEQPQGEAAAIPEAEGAPLFDMPSEAQVELAPEAAPQRQFKADPALIERWEKLTPERQDETAMWANKALLSERQLANRQKKADAVKKETDRVKEFLDDQIRLQKGQIEQVIFDQKWPEGKDPVLPKGAALEPERELAEHQAALEYLDWYDNRIARREPEPGQREAMEVELIRRGIANGELRPPDLEIPAIDEVADVDIPGALAEIVSGKPGERAARAAEVELQLREAQAAQDAEMEASMLEAEREATGYFEATTEELMPEILNEVAPVESVSIADSLRALMNQMVESDRRTFRTIGELLDTTHAFIDEVGGGRKAPAQPALPAAGAAPAFTLPADLKRSAPRYSSTKLEFESDLDKAAYIIGRDSITGKRSKAAEKFERALVDAGISIESARNHGRNVYREVKRLAGGGAAAPKSVTIPAQSWDLPDSGRAPTIKSRKRSWDELKHLPEGHPDRISWIKGAVREAKAFREVDFVKAWASMKVGSVTDRLLAQFRTDMEDAVREGIRVSGINPERFRLVEDVDTTKLFGRDAAIESMSGWYEKGSHEAELISADPSGPEADYLLAGRSTGLYTYEPGMRTLSDTIHVSLSLALDSLAEARAGVRKTIGSDVHRTTYHEAFHRLQVHALTIDELALMGTSEARARMKTIIQEGGGEWSDSMLTGGMDGQMELEAESFAVWAAQKRVRLKGGGLDAIYEKLNDLTKTVRRAIRQLSGKNAAQDLMDVFDMAYRGEVGKRSPSDMKNLADTADVELMTLVPKLKESIDAMISSKRAEAIAARERLIKLLDDGGCT